MHLDFCLAVADFYFSIYPNFSTNFLFKFFIVRFMLWSYLRQTKAQAICNRQFSNTDIIVYQYHHRGTER